METLTFPALHCPHGFTALVQGLDVKTDRATALARLEEHHAAARQELGLGGRRYVTAEQVHGAHVAVVTAETAVPVAECDGLMTNDPAVCLGIYVADCGPVFLFDPVRRVVAALHSGRKGTEQQIAAVAVAKMRAEFGCEPGDIVAQLGPCIRPPHYEVDFAADIIRQCRAAGLTQVHDCALCTASDPARFYSYRRELGKTGRMVALIGLGK